jgi:hypothetical protein
MKSDAAKQRIEAFGKRFGEGHLYFAYHAAFPLALTPDLLYRLWANFQRDAQKEIIGIPWVAVADLLLSNLCEEVGHELYEMDSAVRDNLIQRTKADKRFGEGRIHELSSFLLGYVEQQLQSNDPYVRDFAQTQRWTALAYTQATGAASELALALKESIESGSPAQQLQLTSIIDTLSAPLARFQPLLSYVRQKRAHLQNRRRVSAPQTASDHPVSEPLNIAGVILPPLLSPSPQPESKGSETRPTPPKIDEKYIQQLIYVSKAIIRGHLVPFLGEGINVCGLPKLQERHVPLRRDISRQLSQKFDYPSDDIYDLTRISQYVANSGGNETLYEELHQIFDLDYPVSPVHTLLARLPAFLRKKGIKQAYQLIVTTNYDDLLERAFHQEGEQFDLVTYIASGESKGRFMHLLPQGERRIIEAPNRYTDLSLNERTVILKLHGGIDRADPRHSTFVITEDNYINYPTSSMIPVELRAKLRSSYRLFLGYSPREWSQRLTLSRFFGENKTQFLSWAVQMDSNELEKKDWHMRDTEVLDMSLEEFIEKLSKQLESEMQTGDQYE